MSNWPKEERLETFAEYQARARRSNAARMSNARGKQHETLIDGACRYYESRAIAYIVKEPEPFRVIRKDHNASQARVQFTAKAQPDYHGTLRSGRSIVFEAKYTDTARIQQSVVTAAQAASLTKQEEFGAIALVVVGIQGKAFSVPWMIFRRMKENYGHKYATADNLEEWRVEDWSMVMFLNYKHQAARDWLRAAERQ